MMLLRLLYRGPYALLCRYAYRLTFVSALANSQSTDVRSSRLPLDQGPSFGATVVSTSHRRHPFASANG